MPCSLKLSLARAGTAKRYAKKRKELGGREWMIDGSGEFIVVDRPRGDAMPKTVVSALYNFRDVQDNEGDMGAAPEGSGNDGAGGAVGSGSGLGGGIGGGSGGIGDGGKRKSNSSGDTAFSKGTLQSSSVPRRSVCLQNSSGHAWNDRVTRDRTEGD